MHSFTARQLVDLLATTETVGGKAFMVEARLIQKSGKR
jgi:hypothetical protein